MAILRSSNYRAGLTTRASVAAEQVLGNARRGEDVIARGFQLPTQMRQIDVEELPLPFAHLAGDDHGLDIGAVHQRHDRTRHLVERRHIDPGGVEAMMSASLPGVSD